MALLNSLKKLFKTSKEVTAAKTDDLRDTAAEQLESVKKMGEVIKDKTEGFIEKMDDKAASLVDKLEEKIRGEEEKEADISEDVDLDTTEKTEEEEVKKPNEEANGK